MSAPDDTFPRQWARTRRLTLGEPRDLTITPDGGSVVFARSGVGDDPLNRLWVVDLDTGAERLLADPAVLLDAVAADDVDLPDEERARRERMREGAGGVTSYALDAVGRTAVFALAGHLFVADVALGGARHVSVPGPVFDPRPDPAGQRVAYVQGRRLLVADVAPPDDSGTARVVAAAEPADDDPSTVSWGSADFVAAEEMRRLRGFWWSPDGASLAVCRVDDGPVAEWHIADPARPAAPPAVIRYPAAGSANPDVTLHLVPAVSPGAPPLEVAWDRDALPYLAGVDWNEHGLAITVQSRDQRRLEVLAVDPATGSTSPLWSDRDDDWVELVAGAPRLVAPETVVTCADRDGARRLVVAGEVVSPRDTQIRSIVAATADEVVVTANPLDDATVQHVHRWTPRGFDRLTDGDGVHTAVASGSTVIVRTATLDEPGGRWVLPSGAELAGHAERPLVELAIHLVPHSHRAPATAVLLPHDHDGSPLPVLLDPYGGPHAQRVVRSHNAHVASQWFADQGFAVVVADGRGTPGRGSAFERSVRDDLATGVLDDQVAALHAAADRRRELDLDRVAIRGWSFGGYLAALAVLRRPDVFHAAIAGAPVTDWRLYDTHYTERYLGHPAARARDLRRELDCCTADAAGLTRPLLLIHGLADDNVVAAHTLQLSSALLAAGRPHEVLPLVGVTHMTPQEVVAEHLLLHQLEFLRRSLPPTAPPDDT